MNPAPHLPDPPVRHGALARLRSLVVLALGAAALALAVLAADLYRQEFADTRQRLDLAGRVAQEHALKLFDTNQMLMQRMLDLLGDDDDPALLARGRRLHEELARMAAGLPQVQGLYVNGADARMLASNRSFPPLREIDFTDREWYRAHRDGTVSVFVTEQLVSRSTGEAFFDMSRRRTLSDGRFGGVVNVSLRPQYLTDFYRELAAAAPGLRMAIVRSDGRLLARWPGGLNAADPAANTATARLMQSIASGAAAGQVDGPSGLDGTDRLRVFRRLGSYPLYVVASIDRAAVVGAWLRRCGWLALLVLPPALGFAWMARVALRHTQREADASRRLDDETQRRQRAELALVQSQKLEALGRLTGGVAHDFNNLLMVIGSNLHVLRRKHAALADNPQLAAMDRAVGGGAKLTRQLLAFARKQALLPERIVLQQRLPELIELLRPLLGADVQTDCEVAADIAAIEVDPAELELALLNLAVNARDAMHGRGSVRVRARNAGAGERPAGMAAAVLVEVHDSGPGIEPDVAARAFEPFFTTKPVGQGTGLGLAQVQALCAGAGGSARIATAGGGGTCVQLCFAAAAPPPEQPAPAALPPAQALAARVLLVEDNAAVAQATTELLLSLGCSVVAVPGAAAALARIDAAPQAFDLVLSDIEMPGELDGVALATALLERRPPLPVLLMTGYASRLEQAARARLEVLPKPCSAALLAEGISRALARERARAAASGPADAVSP